MTADGIADLRSAAAAPDRDDWIEFRPDGVAVLRPIGVEVHRIAALLDPPEGEMTVDEVCEDYPSLTREAVEAAREYATAHPWEGEPFPGITFKRAFRGIGLEALDEVLGPTHTDP